MSKLDWYIIKKFLLTFFFMLGIIMMFAIVFDVSEKLGDFISNQAPLEKIIFDYYVNFIILSNKPNPNCTPRFFNRKSMIADPTKKTEMDMQMASSKTINQMLAIRLNRQTSLAIQNSCTVTKSSLGRGHREFLSN